MKYIAEVFNVQDVSLIVRAESRALAEPLHRYGLHPFTREGQAEVLIGGVSANWKGKRFRELVVAVFVCSEPGRRQPDGFFLAAAFHSSRLFGWIERTFFKTPHRWASIDVDSSPPAGFACRLGTACVVQARMGEARAAAREEDQDLEVPLYLPDKAGDGRRSRRYFRAHIRGPTRIYPFDPNADTFAIHQVEGDDWMAAVVRSAPAAIEWHIREAAIHARTRTAGEPIDSNGGPSLRRTWPAG